MKHLIGTLFFATAVSAAYATAYTYEWTGTAPDGSGVLNWRTEGNWSSSDGGTSFPGNEDTSVFSQQGDLTVTVDVPSNNAQPVQAIHVSEGAGALTIRTGQGWFNERILQFRKDTYAPVITNFINKSSNPVTFFGVDSSNLRVTVGNAWGECKFGPGAIYDLPFAVTDTKVWFVGQAEARTDNEEMNKSVFKKTATIKTADIAINHWVEVSGSLDVAEELAVKGKLVVDGASAVVSCATLVVDATGAIGGSGTIHGTVGGAYGAKLLFSEEEVLTFDADADISGLTVDATGCDPTQEYLVAKGTTSLPGVSAAQSADGWMTLAKDGNVYLVNSMTVVNEDVTLDADTDWSATPITVAGNVTIDLNGHSLSVAGITLGTGVTFVNNGADKSRLYVGLNGADKSWVLGLDLGANIMPVFVGATVEIPQSYVPAGGIGFKNTSGVQTVYAASCANGMAFLGGAKITETLKDWQNANFHVSVYGDGNTFTLYADNSWSKDGSFSNKTLSGDGTLVITSTDRIGTAYSIGSDMIDNSGFTGRLVLKWGANFGQAIEFADPKTQANKHFPNAAVVLCGKDSGGESQFLLASGNGSSTANFCFDSLETDGDNASKVILSTSCSSSGGTYLRIGTNGGGSGVFAGSFTNYNGDAARPYSIVKNGIGTWTLTGTVANGGTFTVAAGGVEFRNGLANVTSLTVASGASALFAGDMGSNPISFAAGSTLKLDASNEGDNVPVVDGNLDLTGVGVYVSQGTYVPSKTTPRELLRVTGDFIGLDRKGIETDIDADGWGFRVVTNENGSKSIFHEKKDSFAIILR